MPDRPDPVTDRLARFTPAAAGLDRDALLFEAGRRSARSSRLWPLAAGLLAVSQVATLVVLWPHEPARPSVAPVAPTAAPPAAYPLPPASPDPGLWSAGSRPDVLERPGAGAAGEFVSAGPPLTAGSAPRFD
ncbi:MAG TPA: hypothetical protein VKE40_24850 [Gemmataceae bacterium]|nr:hypothetical protein [Gemmataceae bacterium]